MRTGTAAGVVCTLVLLRDDDDALGGYSDGVRPTSALLAPAVHTALLDGLHQLVASAAACP